jgi:DNA polymerase III subunit beta
MHFTIESELLAESFKKVEKVVNAKHPTPILQGIFMEVTEQEIILIGSDGTESFDYHIPVDGQNINVFEPGKTVLPKQAYEISKKLKKKLDLKLTGFNLTIKYGKKSEFNLNTFDPLEYPKLPKVEMEKPTFTFKGTDFNSFIKKTAYAASVSETRPILTGVSLTVVEDCISFVSTDSHRLGQVKTSSGRENSSDLKLVIPAKSLDKLLKTFDLQLDVDVYCESANQVVFRNGALFFYSRLLEGNYPDTSRLIPTEFESEMKINRKELLESLDRISGLANHTDNGKGGVVKLHLNGVATLSTHQSQIGKGVEVIEYEELTGIDDYEISFSANYMIDALKAIDDKLVCFKYQGNMRPFLLTPCESALKEEIQLILPVRTI